MERRVILASQSPRRAELFKRIFSDFEVIPSHSEETAEETDPRALVRALAREKAEEVFSRNSDALVVGADTVVWLAGRRYGKPRDRADAAEMLATLSGKEHSVLTGVCVCALEGSWDFACESFVRFRRLDKSFLSAYLMKKHTRGGGKQGKGKNGNKKK